MSNQTQYKTYMCIDTSTSSASIAIAKATQSGDISLVYSSYIDDGLTHSQKLIPMIDKALSSCTLSVCDVDVFACINGPGSFTGLRIGISTIKALADSKEKQIVDVSTLEALAYALANFCGTVIPLIDARRDNAYTACFDNNNYNMARCKDDEMLSIDEVIDIAKDIEGEIIFVGCGTNKAKERILKEIGKRAHFASSYNNKPNASVGVEIAIKKYLVGDSKREIKPNYVKEISAKPQSEQGAKRY